MTARCLVTEAVIVDDAGRVIACLLPELPEDASTDVREGLVRRRLTALRGTCPCGATALMPNRAARRRAARSGVMARIVVEHVDDCPAVDRLLVPALGRWAT